MTMNVLSKFLITIGAISLFYACLLTWERNNPQRLSFSSYSQPTKYHPTVTPAYIHIPDLKINLPIYPAIKNGKDWDTTTKGVSYLISTPVPGTKGNAVLYGHNWNNLLGRLHKAKIGNRVAITYKNGKNIYFRINSLAVVSPDQVGILNDTKDTRITLYTCTGFLDNKRLVITALAEDQNAHSLINIHEN